MMFKYLFLLLAVSCGSSLQQESKTIYVAPQLRDCTGVGPQKCMLIRETPDEAWRNFYDQIEGFTYEKGYTYKLLVSVTGVDNPPADASSLKYTLQEILSKEAAPEQISLYQNWKVIKLEGMEMISGKPTISFEEENGQVTGSTGCNNFFGSFSKNANDLSFGPLGMTRKMCQEMKTEDVMARYLEQVKHYTIVDGILILENENRDPLIYCSFL
jgi:heat shock protein HslJ